MKSEARGIQEAPIESPNLTTFSDVTFQLLIFFMLTVQFSDMAVEKLKLPTSVRPDKTRGDPTMLLVNVRKDGTVAIGGRVWYDARWSSDAARDRTAWTNLEDLFIRRRADCRNRENPHDPLSPARYCLLVRADRSTGFEHVQRLLMMASRLGGVARIMFATTGENRAD